MGNASRFEEEGWGGEMIRIQTIKMKTNTEQNTEMKINLIVIDEEEQKKGRGFMKQVKEDKMPNTQNTQESAWKSLETMHHDFKNITR